MTIETIATMTDRQLSEAFAISLNMAIDNGPLHIGTMPIIVADTQERYDRLSMLLAEIKRRPDYAPGRA